MKPTPKPARRYWAVQDRYGALLPTDHPQIWPTINMAEVFRYEPWVNSKGKPLAVKVVEVEVRIVGRWK